MDMLGLYASMRKDIRAVKNTADKVRTAIDDNTVTASHLHGGIRTHAFEFMFSRLSFHWDASDPAVDLTAQDYGFDTVRLRTFGIDAAAMTSGLTERDRPKLVNFWRADKASGTYNPGPDLAALRTAMIAARAWVIANYPLGAGGVDEGTVIDADGIRTSKIYSAGEFDALGPLLDDVSTACSDLL